MKDVALAKGCLGYLPLVLTCFERGIFVSVMREELSELAHVPVMCVLGVVESFAFA